MSTRKTTNIVDAAFGQRVVEIREIRGETQVEFARQIKTTQAAVVNYEAGRIPKGDICLRIASLDRKKRGLEWLLTAKVAQLYKDRVSEKGLVWNEPPEMFTEDPKRQELLRKVKRLIGVAEDHTIDALMRNVDEFSYWYNLEPGGPQKKKKDE